MRRAAHVCGHSQDVLLARVVDVDVHDELRRRLWRLWGRRRLRKLSQPSAARLARTAMPGGDTDG